jgi:L-ornithine Nalpha-acyltransferase
VQITPGEVHVTHQLNPVSALPIALGSGTECIEVRLAASSDEIRAAQRLRYRVFYEEMGARPSPRTKASGLDRDDFDEVCDHLLAIAGGEVVGTYRLIRREAAQRVGGFYSAAEFDIAPLLAHAGPVLELGRSCVDARWRNRGAVQQLWQGLAGYIVHHRIGLLFGCGSLAGTDLDALAPQLAYLHENHLAPEELRPRALSSHGDAILRSPSAYEPRRVLHSLPPLLKGYLRAGASVGEGWVIDEQFNTTDVLVVLGTEAITRRYRFRYDQVGKAA